VLLIIAPIVLRELDKKKDSDQNDKIRKRCRDTIKELEKYHDNEEIKEDIFLNFIPIEPQIDWIQNGLAPDVNDDRLIASMIIEEDISKLVLVTSDLGLKLKAGIKGIKTVKLDDSLKEEVRIDPDAKRIQELEKKLARYENASPKLDLYILSSPDAKFHEFGFKKVQDVDPTTIEIEIGKMRNHLEYQKPQEDKGLGVLGSFNNIQEDEITRYKNEVEEYLKKLREYYKNRKRYENFKSRLFCLDIVLSNVGEKVASDIDIFLHFPDGFRMLSKDEVSKYNEPSSPERPTPPKTVLESLSMHSSIGLYPNNFNSLMTHINDFTPMKLGIDYSLVSIEKNHSYDVHFQVKKLKQNMEMALDSLYLLFNSYVDIKSFSFEYVINVENHPDEFRGEYHIKFKPVG
jgi:rRNA-processing protein FCF1